VVDAAVVEAVEVEAVPVVADQASQDDQAGQGDVEADGEVEADVEAEAEAEAGELEAPAAVETAVVAEAAAVVDEPVYVRARTPEVPEGADISALDPEVKQELRGLPKGLADIVGRHLAAAGMLIDSEPELALEHARYARSKAARVAVVREAAGLTAYHAGEWAEALSELRAARRMSNSTGHVAVMADCERALGRPERAIELAREAQVATLAPEEAVELRIVAAGARRDMGQLDAAVVALQGDDLDEKRREPWSARLFYAYADNLEAAGRTDEAVKWFLNAAQADDDNETDAAERAFDLSPQE
jgi:tetratricopeptide (TPR) repeat protein